MLWHRHHPLTPQTRLRGCTDISQQQGQDAGKLGVHGKSTAIPQATKTIMEPDSSCAQTCDYVVCSMSNTVTRFSIEQTQATEGHCPGNTLMSLQEKAAGKAWAALASSNSPRIKSQKHFPVGFACAMISSAWNGIPKLRGKSDLLCPWLIWSVTQAAERALLEFQQNC